MTVADLIARLERFDPDLPVYGSHDGLTADRWLQPEDVHRAYTVDPERARQDPTAKGIIPAVIVRT